MQAAVNHAGPGSKGQEEFEFGRRKLDLPAAFPYPALVFRDHQLAALQHFFGNRFAFYSAKDRSDTRGQLPEEKGLVM